MLGVVAKLREAGQRDAELEALGTRWWLGWPQAQRNRTGRLAPYSRTWGRTQCHAEPLCGHGFISDACKCHLVPLSHFGPPSRAQHYTLVHSLGSITSLCGCENQNLLASRGSCSPLPCTSCRSSRPGNRNTCGRGSQSVSQSIDRAAQAACLRAAVARGARYWQDLGDAVRLNRRSESCQGTAQHQVCFQQVGTRF